MENYNSKYKIFIAHPNEKSVELYRSKLPDNFQVDSAHDGLLSLRKIKLHKPHIILSSVDLPTMSGLSLLKFVRSHAELSLRPFIILGHTTEIPLALSLGASDFIDYDMPSDQILAKIYHHIRINQ